jgi:hypothetical protein
MSFISAIAKCFSSLSSKPIDPTRELPSTYRKMRHVASKIFHDAFVSLFSFRKANVTSATYKKIERMKRNDSNLYNTIAAIRDNKTLTGIKLLPYCERLNVEYGTQTIQGYAQQGMDPHNLPEATSDKILIPIVLKGLVRNHIVAVFFDRETNTLEYYDPKGLSIEDRHSEYLLNTAGGRITLNEAIENIKQKYGKEEEYIVTHENTHKHQWDSHNCGVYVCDFFRRRLQPDTNFFDVVMNRRFDTLKMREEMIEFIAR